MYNKNTHIHFVGIGGIGMSGIATILRNQGYTVSGCDIDLDQKSVHDLCRLGCEIYQGNNSPQCQAALPDILVYSTAIKAQDPELLAAQKRGIPTVHRSLMLAELMRTKYSIAVSGSHGKTTTTSLISHLLLQDQMDPTVVIGGHLQTIDSNAHLGTGDFLVAEADESDRSFLQLPTTLAVVTNIDLEHLETYKDLDDIKQSFASFLQKVPFYGKAIVCIDDENIQSLLPLLHVHLITYGIHHPKAMITARDIVLNPDHTTFTVWHKSEEQCLGTVKLSIPGIHNVLNALATFAIAQELGISFEIIARTLATFPGVDRRFTYRGSYKGIEIFDDYGHHPNEIYHTLTVARRRAQEKLVVVFQPHRYSRTQALWNDFVSIFMTASIDELIVTDIHAASEQPIEHITSQRLVQEIQQRYPSLKITYVPFEQTLEKVQEVTQKYSGKDNLILFLGAGKITKLSTMLSGL